ncbi:hypothetical protein B296_00031357 [Ensete ventricosum]|uniref:Uncharacterized protein n=1 Tax=Ensete ventricosum TaxID=4639 RepID=A0A426XBG1_ENSVE|nr:hypothetical protein B296_00031357 [Ensete ventricosum]
MTTDDAHDRRFKAFEARMENRFQELLREIRRSRSESSKKTQHGESSKGNRSEKCDQGHDTGYTRIRVEFPIAATVVIFLSSFLAAVATCSRCLLPWPPLPPSATSVPLFPLLLSSLFQPLPSSLVTTPPPSTAHAPCFLCRCSRCNHPLGRALLCHRGHLCSSPLLLTTPLPSLLPLRPSLLQPLSNVPLPCSPPQSLPPATLLHRQQHQPQPSSPANHLPLLVVPTPSAATVAPPLRRKLMPLTQQQKKELNIIDLQSYTMTTDDALDAMFKSSRLVWKTDFKSSFAKLEEVDQRVPRKLNMVKVPKGVDLKSVIRGRTQDTHALGHTSPLPSPLAASSSVSHLCSSLPFAVVQPLLTAAIFPRSHSCPPLQHLHLASSVVAAAVTTSSAAPSSATEVTSVLPFTPHNTTAFSLAAAALAVAATFKRAPTLLSSSIAASNHSSLPTATSAATLVARQPLVASSRTNSLCSNRGPSPTMQTHAPNSTAEKRTEHH